MKYGNLFEKKEKMQLKNVTVIFCWQSVCNKKRVLFFSFVSSLQHGLHRWMRWDLVLYSQWLPVSFMPENVPLKRAVRCRSRGGGERGGGCCVIFPSSGSKGWMCLNLLHTFRLHTKLEPDLTAHLTFRRCSHKYPCCISVHLVSWYTATKCCDGLCQSL